MTGSLGWLGHHDLCSLQWSDYCDCEGKAASNLQAELDRLEQTDPDVKAASAGLDAVYEHVKGRLPSDQVAAIYEPEVER